MKSLPEYKSLQDKQGYFEKGTEDLPWEINTTEEFDQLYDFLIEKSNIDFNSGSPCIYYRGVNEAKYQTFTSAQRHWLWNEWKDDSRKGFIDYIAQELHNIRNSSVLKNYYRSIGVHPNDLLYLAFLQHYGASSPLLDLTHSIDTSLFFAFDNMTALKNKNGNIENYVALQILDFTKYSQDHFGNMIDFLDSGIKSTISAVNEWKANHPDHDIDDSLIKDISKFTAWYNPSNPQGGLSNLNIALIDFIKDKIVLDLTGRSLYWSNIRLIAQQGAFLFYSEHEKPLEKYLLDKKAPLLQCINIHKSLKGHVLKRINKDKTTIYPSEESIAKDANFRAINTLQRQK